MRLSSACSPEGSLPRSGLKYQSTAAQSVGQHVAGGWNKTCCPKCALLDSGLRNTWEPRSHSTERWSYNGSEGLNLRPIVAFRRHTVPLRTITDPPPNQSCCGKHNILHSVSRFLSHLYVLSFVKRTHRQSWCSLTNANHSAESWGVRTGPTHGCRTLIPHTKEYDQTVWAETYTQWPTGGYFAGIWQRVVDSRLMTPLGMWTLTTYKSDQDVSQKGWKQTSGLQSPSIKLVLCKGHLANCLSWPPVACCICKAAGEIHSQCCFLTGEVGLTEVRLTWSYIELFKCTLNSCVCVGFFFS